jgi:hypothetical protein
LSQALLFLPHLRPQLQHRLGKQLVQVQGQPELLLLQQLPEGNLKGSNLQKDSALFVHFLVLYTITS